MMDARTLQRRYECVLNLLADLYPFERQMERAYGKAYGKPLWSARAIRRALIAGGRMRKNALNGKEYSGPTGLEGTKRNQKTWSDLQFCEKGKSND